MDALGDDRAERARLGVGAAEFQPLGDAARAAGDTLSGDARLDRYPSSKQVAFAERIARIKRRSVPDACFKDRTLMSRWIDSNR